ncbi:MAG: hypothetical protein ACKVWR_05260 [Acidimicrobiales bacterium]
MSAPAAGAPVEQAEACPDPLPDRPSFAPGVRDAVLAGAAGLDRWTGGPLPAAWQVDHVLAWREALCSGLAVGERHAFYSYAPNLAATASAVNAAKSDWGPGSCREPAARRATGSCPGGGWTPPDQSARCWFAVTWLATKARFALGVDPEEAAQLTAERARCGE